MKEKLINIARRFFKILDIGYATFIYIGFAIAITLLSAKIYGPIDQNIENQKSTPTLIGLVIAKTWYIAVLSYIIRNIFHFLPFPLQGILGYQHFKTREVVSSSVFLTFMTIFDRSLQTWMTILKTRVGI